MDRLRNRKSSKFRKLINHSDDSELQIFKFKPLKIQLEYMTKVNRNDSGTFSDTEPSPRSGHRIVCHNNRYVYSYGGYCPTQLNDGTVLHEVYKELWKFDDVTKKWELVQVPNMPTQAASNCCTLLGKNILTVYGGTSFPFGDSNGNDVYFLDLNKFCDFQKLSVPALEKPIGRYGQAIVIDDNYLYSVGGTTGFVYSMDIHRLDLTTGVWTLLYNYERDSVSGDPEPRYRHEIVLYENQIYLFGGGRESSTSNLESIHAFDLSRNSWRTYQTKQDTNSLYPVARKCHGCVQLKKNSPFVYILGGINVSALKDIWILDLNQLKWTKLGVNLLHKLYFHAVSINNDGKVFIFGGIEVDAQRRRRRMSERGGERERGNVERTSNLYSIYVTIPCLKVIAMEAVKYYSQNTQIYDRALLETYGITL